MNNLSPLLDYRYDVKRQVSNNKQKTINFIEDLFDYDQLQKISNNLKSLSLPFIFPPFFSSTKREISTIKEAKSVLKDNYFQSQYHDEYPDIQVLFLPSETIQDLERQIQLLEEMEKVLNRSKLKVDDNQDLIAKTNYSNVNVNKTINVELMKIHEGNGDFIKSNDIIISSCYSHDPLPGCNDSGQISFDEWAFS